MVRLNFASEQSVLSFDEEAEVDIFDVRIFINSVGDVVRVDYVIGLQSVLT